jgi:hypothetical protein
MVVCFFSFNFGKVNLIGYFLLQFQTTPLANRPNV